MRWTDEEGWIVRENYPDHGLKWSGWDEALPTRTREAIRDYARRHHINCTKETRSRIASRDFKYARDAALAKRQNLLSREDIDAIYRLYYRVGAQGIIDSGYCKGHTYATVAAVANKFGLVHPQDPELMNREISVILPLVKSLMDQGKRQHDIIFVLANRWKVPQCKAEKKFKYLLKCARAKKRSEEHERN